MKGFHTGHAFALLRNLEAVDEENHSSIDADKVARKDLEHDACPRVRQAPRVDLNAKEPEQRLVEGRIEVERTNDACDAAQVASHHEANDRGHEDEKGHLSGEQRAELRENGKKAYPRHGVLL